MAWLGIVILVLICGLIGGYVYLVEYHGSRADEPLTAAPGENTTRTDPAV
jgi:hypothetical protein